MDLNFCYYKKFNRFFVLRDYTSIKSGDLVIVSSLKRL